MQESKKTKQKINNKQQTSKRTKTKQQKTNKTKQIENINKR